VLALRRKLSGPEHPDTLEAMHNLASSYQDVGRRDEALRMQEESLALCRKVFGPEHPMTLMGLHNLATYLDDAGRGDEALKLSEESLALSRKVNGPEHPTTLTAMHNLAVSYSDVDRPDEALKMQEEVLALCPKVHGPEHPETFTAMTNLAASYSLVGRWDEGIKIQEEVVALRRKVSGSLHPDTLKAMAVLQMLRLGSNDPAIHAIVLNPIGFPLIDLAAKDEAGRTLLLGEPDMTTSGESRDGETGVAYDDERSYEVNGYDLEVLLRGGKIQQVNVRTGDDTKLRGIAAVGPFLGDKVEIGKPESDPGSTASFHKAAVKGSAPWRVYVEFDEDGLADSAKFVPPGE
jgi:tetratricopeptide (TPR) repeat protein